MCYVLYTYPYFSTCFQKVFVFLFLCNKRVSCILSAYLGVKGNSTFSKYISTLSILQCTSGFSFFKSVEIFFQKLKKKWVFFQDLAKILKLVNHDVSLQMSEIDFFVLIEKESSYWNDFLPIFYLYCKSGFIS